MSQNRESGDAGRRFGLECGKRVAAALGARKISGTSNECLWNGSRVVIKCARRGNQTVGVVLSMLERIDAVLGVFEVGDNEFEVLQMSVGQYRGNMRERRPTRAPPQGMMNRGRFLEVGERVSVLTFDPPLERLRVENTP